LLKLRVSFEENASTEAYKVDFRLHDEHKNTIILVKGPVNSSEATGQWKGDDDLKVRFLNEEFRNKVHVIDSQQWNDMTPLQQMGMLYDIVGVKGIKKMKE